MMERRGLISLLGCGWLGLPLAKALISSGLAVKASTTSASKLELLRQNGIDPYLVQFSAEDIAGDLESMFHADVLVITIPPGRKAPEGFASYENMIRAVCRNLKNSKPSKLILISSTSVYGDINGIVDEYSDVSPDTASGQLMVDSERILNKEYPGLITLRLAGLVGPGRMPGRFFAGKVDVPNGLAPVNLIHLTDVIGLIQLLISDKNAAGIYNGCAPEHPSREDFYTLASRIEGLPEPCFITEKQSWKIVSSIRFAGRSQYNFKFASPIDWLHTIKP